MAGYEQFSSELSTLLSTYPPPFIYIQDSESFKSTCQVVNSVISAIEQVPPPSSPSSLFSSSSTSTTPFIIHSTRIDAVSTFTNRLLFESVINSLARWDVTWEDGCSNWIPNVDSQDGGEQEIDPRWNENVDTFIHALRAVHGYLCRQHGISRGKGKGKAIQNDSSYENIRLVIVIERAERLKETNPELVVPLTRLAEMVYLIYIPYSSNSLINTGTIGYNRYIHFSSRLGEYQTFIRRFSRSLLHGYTTALQRKSVNLNLPHQKRPISSIPLDVAKFLTQSFTSQSLSNHSQPPTSPYHPSLTPLYSHFITLLTDICFPFIHNPYELQYIAAARWPGFVKPVLDEYERERADESMDVDMDLDTEEEEEQGKSKKPTFILPSEHTRMRLNRLFSSSLTNALESLHPRLSNATDWALSNQPEPNLLSKSFTHTQQQRQHPPSNATLPLVTATGINTLPRISKFILVASFIASTNPPKSDIRMFGRGLDEKKRKKRIRRVGGGGRKVKADGTTTAAKVNFLFFSLSKLPITYFLFY
jgi:origin recognition complex subunit 5